MSTAVAEKPNTEIAEKKPSPLATMRGWLQSDQFKDAVSKALPKHMTPDRFLRIALTSAMQTPKLMQCTQESMFSCLLKLSQYGLEPDGRRAYLIPFDVKKKNGSQWVVDHTDATLIVGYQGLAELVMRSGLVSNIHADVICENDTFDYDKGFITTHRIDFRKPRGEAYAAYAVVRFKDGTEKCEVMSKEDILRIRDGSQGWQSFQKGYAKQSPWDPKNPGSEREMWKKTCFRRLSKWVPLSAEIREAAELDDDQVDIDTVETTTTIASTATSKSDALAEMMMQRMESKPTDGDHPGQDEQAAEPEAEKPTLVELLARVPIATRDSDLHEIGDMSGHLSPADLSKLTEALNDRGEELKAKKSDGKLPLK